MTTYKVITQSSHISGYLAHVCSAETAPMRRRGGIMIWENPKPPIFINRARICVDLRETIKQTMMFEDCLNKQEISITHYPQFTPEKSWPKSLGLKGHIKITTQPKSKGLLRKKITQGHKLIWWPRWFVDARESFSSNLQSLQLFFLMNEVHPSFYPEASTKPEKTFEYWRYKNNNQD